MLQQSNVWNYTPVEYRPTLSAVNLSIIILHFRILTHSPFAESYLQHGGVVLFAIQ